MSAILCYKQHGVTRNQLASLCINTFNFPEQYQDLLSKYRLIQWSGRMFADHLKSGVITFLGDEYLVVYKDCTPSKVMKADQIRLSFRKPKDEFEVRGYVIVKILPAIPTPLEFKP